MLSAVPDRMFISAFGIDKVTKRNKKYRLVNFGGNKKM
jgi:hypothetical protein